MAKASLRLPNGTNVTIEGTPEEIKGLLTYYGGQQSQGETSENKTVSHSKKTKPTHSSSQQTQHEPDITAIVNMIKNCEESESIEKHILDRISTVDRTLLPLFIVHKHLANAYGLTSGDINRVTTELGIPIAAPNIANTLAGSASRYVVGDKLRIKGHAVRYKLSRRGFQYLQSVITGDNDGK
jgi:hypothetical protein